MEVATDQESEHEKRTMDIGLKRDAVEIRDKTLYGNSHHMLHAKNLALNFSFLFLMKDIKQHQLSIVVGPVVYLVKLNCYIQLNCGLMR